jgi:hypothetical protein
LLVFEVSLFAHGRLVLLMRQSRCKAASARTDDSTHPPSVGIPFRPHAGVSAAIPFPRRDVPIAQFRRDRRRRRRDGEKESHAKERRKKARRADVPRFRRARHARRTRIHEEGHHRRSGGAMLDDLEDDELTDDEIDELTARRVLRPRHASRRSSARRIKPRRRTRENSSQSRRRRYRSCARIVKANGRHSSRAA